MKLRQLIIIPNDTGHDNIVLIISEDGKMYTSDNFLISLKEYILGHGTTPTFYFKELDFNPTVYK